MWAEILRYLREGTLAQLGRDLLDVLITYYIVYRVWLVMRGTRAMQVGAGLALVFALYVVAQLLRLSTVLNILGAVLSSAILIVVVVFQNDIRRGLMRVGSGAWFGGSPSEDRRVIDEVVEAATILARHRTGAIIVFEQEANLDEFVGSNKGHAIDAAVSRDLLTTLFVPEGMNKLHDGAVIIRGRRVAKAGVFFPMPDARVLDQSFGSRHRAAMGITEETDAVVVVVSEERGSISFCFNGNIVSDLDGQKLRAALEGVFSQPASRKGRWEGVREALWRASRLSSSARTPPARAGSEEAKPRDTLRIRTNVPVEAAPASKVPVSSVALSAAPAPLRKKKTKAPKGDAAPGPASLAESATPLTSGASQKMPRMEKVTGRESSEPSKDAEPDERPD